MGEYLIVESVIEDWEKVVLVNFVVYDQWKVVKIMGENEILEGSIDKVSIK